VNSFGRVIEEIPKMVRQFTLSSLLLLGSTVVAGYPGVSRADDSKPGSSQTPSGPEQNIESKKEKAPPVPDFARSYGLPFESVSTLGSRLVDARQKYDPIALALIATEIGIAEKVSGKRADLTAGDVKKEAVELAIMRRRGLELTAMSLMVSDEAVAKKLTDLAEKAKQEEADRVARFKSGERDKGIHVLEVRNTTPVPVSVRINGIHLGWVQGVSQVVFNTSQFYEPNQIFLSAHDQFGDIFRSEYHTGRHHYFVWTLVDQN
jgi:hypothetical protein